MKTRTLIGLLILIVLISGCAEKLGKEGELIKPDELKKLEEYKEHCRKDKEECEKWCKENPKICAKYEELYKEVADLSISWQSMNGPPGGRVKELIQNPSPPYELYAVTHLGIHKSQDKGETWQLTQDLEVFNDLIPDKIDLKKISESEFKGLKFPPKDIGFDYYTKVQNIVTIGNRILANIILHVDGSGEFTNGGLYVSEDLGKSWSRVNLGLPDGVIIANIVQNPKDPNHIVLACKHTVVHEFTSPISELLKESYDGGKTWKKVTDLTAKSNGITDVDIVGSSYYLLNPYGGPSILKIDGDDYESFDTPRIKEFSEMSFGLDTLLFDYEDPNIVYGKTGSIWALGILKSEDGMKTWKKMDRDLVVSSPTIIITHPTDPNIVMTSGNVIQESYLTRDFGTTWEPFTPVNAGDDVKIDPHNTNHILLADEMTNMYESYDSGKTFKKIAQDFSSAKVFDFEIANEKIYVSNIGVGISASDSSKEKGGWHYLTGSSDYAYDIEIDPKNSDILYATYSPKIFENHSSIWKYDKNYKENYGWREILRIENSKGFTALRFDPSNPNKIYAGVTGDSGAIYVSNDKGETWAELNEDLTFTTIWGHSQLQVNPMDKNIVYAGTWGGGSYKTTDAGNSWTLMDEDHTFSPVCLAIYNKDPNIIYACDRTAPKIHKSEDAGKTWTEYYDFGGGYMLSSAIAIDPDNPDMIYASAFKPPMAHTGGLVKIENGQSTEIGKYLPRSVLEIEIDPNNKNIIYITTHIHGVYKSENSGITWQKLDDKNNGLPRIGVYDIDVDPVNGNILYATALCGELPDYMMPPKVIQLLAGFKNLDPEGKCGVYKSIDAGKNWNLILETISEARGIDIDTENNNNLYVADMMGGVWVSNDAGQNWRQENNGLGSISMTSVKIKDNFIYASTQGSGVYSGVINKDNSITWDKTRSNKPKAYVHKIQIEIDPKNPERIYASAYPGGLLRSDDGGKNWNDKNFLTPSIKVDDPNIQGYYSFDINPQNPDIVWMGVYGKGMLVSYDGMDFNMFANGNNNIMKDKHIKSVKINPGNPDNMYVGTEEGVFMTKDKGEHWKSMNNGLETLDIKSLKITSVEFPPFEDNFEKGNANKWEFEKDWSVVKEGNNYVLQGVAHEWIYGGSESWQDYTFETRVKLIQGGLHINFRRSDEGRYFLGFNEGRLSLTKQFNKWKEFADLTRDEGSYNLNQWYDFKIEVKGGNIKIYVDNNLKIEYTDPKPMLKGRIAFESSDESQVYIDDVKVEIGQTDPLIYAGTAGYGIYEFNSANKEWQNLGNTLGGGWWSPWERRMYQFSSILFDPDVPGKIYYGHFPSGFFISEDKGRTWKDSSLGLGNDGMFSLSMHPDNHDILFAGTYNGVSKSVDGGKTWVIKSNGMPSEQWPYTIAIDSNNPDIMYVSTKNGQNKGLCQRNQDTFCGVVMKSTDGGENWFEIMNGLNPRYEFYTLIIYPHNHDILFMSTNNGVYMSRDAGNSWKSINSGLPSKDNQVRDNVADNLALTADNKYLIFGLTDYGAWKADLSEVDLSS